jgi:hypothetical protein
MKLCENCKNPIDQDIKVCEWCGNKVSGKQNENILSLDVIDKEIINLCIKGNKLSAIKLKKENSNLSIKESKIYVNNLLLKEKIPNKKIGCFIATVCYGSYNSEEVLIFRLFRDQVLKKSYIGKKFISFYYFISPPIANLIDKSEFTKSFIRLIILQPLFIYLSKKMR